MSRFAPRQSLAEQLGRVREGAEDDPDEYFMRMDDELEELGVDLEKSKTFRWHAKSTQSRQDHHFLLFKRFVCQYLLKSDPDDISDEDAAKQHLFTPDDFGQMTKRMQLFLVWAFKRAIPRSKAARTIMPATLIAYRTSLLYWSRYWFGLQGADPPCRRLFNDLVQVMRYAVKTYGDPRARTVKSHLGAEDLRMLMDNEAMNNRSIELSEQHVALWCIGRASALRPGSLCPSVPSSYARGQALKWKDFSFVQTEKGKFAMTLRLPRINIKLVDDPMMADDADVSSEPVDLYFPSPTADSLEFSAAHRMLVIAVRRGILENITTLDELFESSLREIRVGAQYLNDVVFYAGGNRGLGLDKSRPLTSGALTEYLRSRGWRAGFTYNVTWYSIRRRAATDLVPLIGLDMTRLVLGHSANSSTLEKYYLRLNAILNAASLLTNNGVETVDNLISSGGWQALAVTSLRDESLTRSRGEALDELVRALILQDSHAPAQDSNSQEFKNYRKRVKAVAKDMLVEKEAEWQKGKMTLQDFQERQRLARSASAFAQEVQSRAAQALEQEEQPSDVAMGGTETETDEDDDEDPDNEPQAGAAEPAEGDLEDAIANGDVGSGGSAIQCAVGSQLDTETSLGGTVLEASYADLAQTAMEIWLQNSMNEAQWWAGKDTTCPLCQEDDTATDVHRAKSYASRHHLDAHLEGGFHLPFTKWKRVQECHREGYWYTCPYCKEADIDPPFTANKMPALIAHVSDSTAEEVLIKKSTVSEEQARLHDRFKAEAGWYEAEFLESIVKASGPSEGSRVKMALAGKKSLKAQGVDLSPQRELVTVETHPTQGRLVFGGGANLAAIPSRHEPTLRVSSNDLQIGQVPERFRDVLVAGSDEGAGTAQNPLPQYLRDDLQRGEDDGAN